jgi:hypothetical protein
MRRAILNMRIKIGAIVAVAYLAFVGAVAVAAEQEDTTIQNTQSLWRANLWFSRIPALLKNGSLDPGPQALHISAVWHKPALDDSEWPRVRGRSFEACGWTNGWASARE